MKIYKHRDTCPKCGSTHIEEHGSQPGDYNWMLCRDCGWSWPTERQKEKDRH